MLRLNKSIAAETGAENLCLAGGVALNCVANGRVLRDGKFKKIWISAASETRRRRVRRSRLITCTWDSRRSIDGALDGMQGADPGPIFERRGGAVSPSGRAGSFISPIRTSSAARLATSPAGWHWAGFRVGCEFGPRALGDRSILADARSPAMQSVLNRRSSTASHSAAVRARRAAQQAERLARRGRRTAPTCCLSPTSPRAGAVR